MNHSGRQNGPFRVVKWVILKNGKKKPHVLYDSFIKTSASVFVEWKKMCTRFLGMKYLQPRRGFQSLRQYGFWWSIVATYLTAFLIPNWRIIAFFFFQKRDKVNVIISLWCIQLEASAIRVILRYHFCFTHNHLTIHFLMEVKERSKDSFEGVSKYAHLFFALAGWLYKHLSSFGKNENKWRKVCRNRGKFVPLHPQKCVLRWLIC